MKFTTAKYVTGALLFIDMALIIASMLLLEKGSSMYNIAFAVIIAVLAVALIIAALWGRCPHCGKRLLSKLYKWEKCPQCGKPLK